MSERYDHKAIEKKWQQRWQESQIFRAQEDLPAGKAGASKPKTYVLDMFPYPSGEGLHVGHPKGYIATDIYARFKRMQGHSVLHPMGWDAFGLPAENYAIKNKIHPAVAVEKNIANFKDQLAHIGFDYDWSREIKTTDPAFYKWTQWIFLQLYKKGLAFQSDEPINWCPSCKTGLANEDLNGNVCERCDTVVEKKRLPQWVLKITDYADRMLHDLDHLQWPEHIKEAQRNWIGRSEGAEIEFIVPRFKEILLASSNESKRARAEKLFKASGLDIKVHTPKSLGLTEIEADENGTLAENAEAKARAYSGKTSLPVLAIDTGFAIEGEDLDLARPKRNALGGIDENSLSQDEVGEKMLKFYQGIAKKHGGRVLAHWIDALALVLPDGSVERAEDSREVILTDIVHGEFDKFFPVRSLYISKTTGKPVKEETPEEEIKELEPMAWAQNELVSRPIKVFTTRPDTLFGASYMVLAPEHPFIPAMKASIENWDEVIAYISEASAKTEIDRTKEGKEKTGVELRGLKAINPANKEQIPLYVADYVLGGYGTGAIMAVPAHDERDFAFAKKFNLPVKKVIDQTKYLIFDFDGVIGDTLENALLAKVRMGFCRDREDAYQEMLTYANKKPVHIRNHTLSPEELQKEYDWTSRFGEEMRKQKIKLFDGFITEIRKLRNTKIAVVSSGSNLYVRSAVEQGKLSPTHVLCFEDNHSKEEKIERICKDWGVSVKDVYYFTDTKADVFELENFLSKERIFGCSWGFLGKEALESVLPKEQVLENFSDIHRVFENLHTDAGMLVESGSFDGLNSEDAKKKITEFVGGKMATTYKLKDWVFSRQRYWGEPIPIIHCPAHGAVAVPEDQLPVLLPEVEFYEPSGTGESPLANITEWVNTTCPTCGGPAKRETNTMPQWAGSSWYYLRFMDPRNDAALVGKDKEKYWAPVDVYVGGDHAVRHLIYARFWHKFLYDIGVVSTVEPFARLEFLGFILAEDGKKMSKRLGNVINPTEVVANYGADSFRIYEMFMGPFENTVAWNTASIAGTTRFIERVWRLAGEPLSEQPATVELEAILHQTAKKVGEDIEAFKFNTAVAQMMTCLNAMEKAEGIRAGQWKAFIRLLAPFAPHVAEELWERLGEPYSVHQAAWPQFDESKISSGTIKVAVQVNGKVRGSIELAQGDTEGEALAKARGAPGVAKWLVEGREVKALYVPGKIISFVVQ